MEKRHGIIGGIIIGIVAYIVIRKLSTIEVNQYVTINGICPEQIETT